MVEDSLFETVQSVFDNRFIFHLKDETWGDSILIMDANGNSFVRLYWFTETSKSVILDWLSVTKENRKQGIGSELIELCELLGTRLDADTICLWTDKNDWMYSWYNRLGYQYFEKYNDEGDVWMEKKLKRCLEHHG